MSAKNSPIIEIKNLHKYFGKGEALRGVGLTVESGKVIVVVGPSGSGKSTLLRCINHLEVETVGEVWVDGKRLNERNKNINEIRAEIGMVFQLFNLFPHLTALENIVLAQKIVRKRSRKEAINIAMQKLERVGIAEKADVFPAQVS